MSHLGTAMSHTAQQRPEEILHVLLPREDQDWLGQIIESYQRMELRSYLRANQAKHTLCPAGIPLQWPISSSYQPEVCGFHPTQMSLEI